MTLPTSEPHDPTLRTGSLLLHCPLREGIAAKLTQWMYAQGGAITYHEQTVDRDTGHYYTCLKWQAHDARRAAGSDATVREGLSALLSGLIGDGEDCEWSLRWSDRPLRMAVFVSRDPTCLYDILARSQSGEWTVDLPLIVGNHPEMEAIARRFGIAFRHDAIDRENKADIEARQIALLEQERIDLVVLARYMQILSERFVRAFPSRIINIHHAFLPAFPGARPYHSAWARGVKMIGATSHYVTETLDAGPIIEQDVRRVSHRHSVADLVRLGRELEKVVLSRAVWAHIEHKVIVHGGRTIVFD